MGCRMRKWMRNSCLFLGFEHKDWLRCDKTMRKWRKRKMRMMPITFPSLLLSVLRYQRETCTLLVWCILCDCLSAISFFVSCLQVNLAFTVRETWDSRDRQTKQYYQASCISSSFGYGDRMWRRTTCFKTCVMLLLLLLVIHSVFIDESIHSVTRSSFCSNFSSSSFVSLMSGRGDHTRVDGHSKWTNPSLCSLFGSCLLFPKTDAINAIKT
jgi:hypothetical protein